MAVRDLGIVTAYGYAVAGGYTGTEQEFTALLGDLALTVEDLENMTVSVTTLEPTEQATASYADGVLSLGIPRGRNGEVTQDDLDAQLENYATNEALFDAYIVKSASGDIASFSDGGDDVPMKSLKVAIVPKQAGSGDPSPSNVRPISGWTDADVHVAERNLFAGAVDEIVPLFLPKLTDVVASASTACVIHYYDINGTEIDYWTLNQTQDGRTYRAFRIKSTADCYYVKFTGNATNFQLEKGTTPTAYEAPHTTPVPLGQTVYGGEVNPISGEMVIDRVTKSGQITAGTSQSYNNVVFGTVLKGADNKGNGNYSVSGAISNMYKVEVSPSEWDSSDNVGKMFCGAQLGNYWIGFEHGTTIEQMKSATENMVICYELATPTTVQLTPTQVASLLGTNNVWADCGSVAVEYRADPTLAYAELQALILENI